jgi:O-antigen/teichoic acid export membrane protein
VADRDRTSAAEAEVAGMEGSRTDAAAATTGASVARGIAWNSLLGILPQLYLLAVSIAAGRFLGPELFGRQSFISFIGLSLATLFGYGLGYALQRFTASVLGEGRPGVVRTLARSIQLIAIPLAGLAAAVPLAFALAGADPALAWSLAGVGAAALVLQYAWRAVLAGHQRWRQLAMVGVTSGAVSTGATIAVLAAGGGITGIFAVEAAVAGLTLVWIWALAGRLLRSDTYSGDAGDAPVRPMFRYAGMATVGVALTLVVWRRSEFLFLNQYSSDSQIGFYSVAFAAIAALIVIPTAIAQTFLPAVATLQGAGQLDRIRTGYARALRLELTLGLVLTAGAAALGPELISLIYGRDFDAAGTLVRIMIVPFPAIAIFLLATNVVEGLGHLRVPMIAGVAAATVNVGLDFALIPRYDAVGAAIATSVAQVVAGAPTLIYSHRLVGGLRWEPLPVAAAAVAAAGGGVAAWACVEAIGGVGGVAAGTIAGLLAFSLVARLLRIFSPEDALWLEETVGDLMGGTVRRAIGFFAKPAPQESA